MWTPWKRASGRPSAGRSSCGWAWGPPPVSSPSTCSEQSAPKANIFSESEFLAVHPRVGLLGGFSLLLGGTLLLAFTQVTRVFIDPRRLELGGSSDTIGDVTWVFLSAAMLATGFAMTLSAVSKAKGTRRGVAVAGAFLSTFIL